nr:MAG TPA: hypothetical protein [Caudoviricetes sp.]
MQLDQKNFAAPLMVALLTTCRFDGTIETAKQIDKGVDLSAHDIT